MSKKKQNNKPAPARDLPPVDFCEWWNPTGTDKPSGADVGGHPDAERTHARKDPGRWVHRTYGINANKAWVCQIYRDEYNAWLAAGRPEREPFVSIALSRDRQHDEMKRIKAILKGGTLPDDSIDF